MKIVKTYQKTEDLKAALSNKCSITAAAGGAGAAVGIASGQTTSSQSLNYMTEGSVNQLRYLYLRTLEGCVKNHSRLFISSLQTNPIYKCDGKKGQMTSRRRAGFGGYCRKWLRVAATSP